MLPAAMQSFGTSLRKRNKGQGEASQKGSDPPNSDGYLFFAMLVLLIFCLLAISILATITLKMRKKISKMKQQFNDNADNVERQEESFNAAEKAGPDEENIPEQKENNFAEQTHCFVPQVFPASQPNYNARKSARSQSEVPVDVGLTRL